MRLFKRRATDPDEMARLKAEIESMAARLQAADDDKRKLDDRVQGLVSSIDEQRRQIEAVPHPEAEPVSQADLDALHGRMTHLAQRVEQNELAATTQPAAAPPGPAPVDAELLDEMREQLLKLDRRIDEQVAVHAASPGVDAAALDALRERVDGIDARVDMVATNGSVDPTLVDALQHRIDDLARRFNVPISAPPRTPPPPPLTGRPDDEPEPVTTQELADLRERVTDFGDRLDGVDTRLVSISRELALQIDELSSELDRRDGDHDAADHEAVAVLVEELRDAQTQLASEQARYQIAFREDLATIADRLRRG